MRAPQPAARRGPAGGRPEPGPRAAPPPAGQREHTQGHLGSLPHVTGALGSLQLPEVRLPRFPARGPAVPEPRACGMCAMQPARTWGPCGDTPPATKALKATRLRKETFEKPVPNGDLSAQERKICHLLDFPELSQEKFTKLIYDVISS